MPEISVLVIHNRYQQPGGEDAVVAAEIGALRAGGHRVIQYSRNNSEIAGYNLLRKASLSLSTSWSHRTYREVRQLIRAERPDVAHVHNFFPLVSPAAHYACKSAGVPVIQTLHNYRLFCPAGTLFAAGERCNRCSGTFANGIRHGCYRNSRLQTATVSLMLSSHRLCGTWERCVNAYLVPSAFCRDYAVSAGIPAAKVHVHRNWLAQDPGPRTRSGDYALFIGRLSPEKGVLEMIDAWAQLPDVPLLVAGDGPLFGKTQLAVDRANGNVKLLGQLNAEKTVAHIKGARLLIFPSRWHEPFGMALLEAAACGVPAIASRVGGVPELVRDHQTGLLFDPDNLAELPERVRWAWSHSTEMEQMGAAARRHYLKQFTAEKSYDALMSIVRGLLH